MVGLADLACPVYLVKKAIQELADLEKRVNLDDQVQKDSMVDLVRRVTKAYQACYPHFAIIIVPLYS